MELSLSGVDGALCGAPRRYKVQTGKLKHPRRWTDGYSGQREADAKMGWMDIKAGWEGLSDQSPIAGAQQDAALLN
ncbi:hypothetical protein ACSS6W_000629 [Trichoderma asperelloides]